MWNKHRSAGQLKIWWRKKICAVGSSLWHVSLKNYCCWTSINIPARYYNKENSALPFFPLILTYSLPKYYGKLTQLSGCVKGCD
jgi:hypothetical protein